LFDVPVKTKSGNGNLFSRPRSPSKVAKIFGGKPTRQSPFTTTPSLTTRSRGAAHWRNGAFLNLFFSRLLFRRKSDGESFTRGSDVEVIETFLNFRKKKLSTLKKSVFVANLKNQPALFVIDEKASLVWVSILKCFPEHLIRVFYKTP
jgi:hypothetical protein